MSNIYITAGVNPLTGMCVTIKNSENGITLRLDQGHECCMPLPSRKLDKADINFIKYLLNEDEEHKHE